MAHWLNLYLLDDESNRGSTYGVGTYIRVLAELLKDEIAIHVVYLNAKVSAFTEEEQSGVTYWRIPANRSTDRESYYKSVVLEIESHIKDKSNLIFHLNYSNTASFVDDLKNTLGCKVVSTAHGFGWCYELYGSLPRLKYILAKEYDPADRTLCALVSRDVNRERAYYAAMDKVVCLCEYTYKFITEDYGISENRLSVVLNGLPYTATRYTPNVKKALREKYGIPSDSPVVLFVGRLEPIKGLSYAIEAFIGSLDRYPNAHFIIAGDGDYGKHIKECNGKWMNIHFTGMLGRGQLSELYAIADIGIMPSFHEQCSYVAIEMMMHGIPIIASTSTGLCEMVENGKTGMHIPVEEHLDETWIDTDMLTDTINRLIDAPSKRVQMRLRSRQRYEGIYSEKNVRKNMLELYHSLFR